jgi:hypothetical protein
MPINWLDFFATHSIAYPCEQLHIASSCQGMYNPYTNVTVPLHQHNYPQSFSVNHIPNSGKQASLPSLQVGGQMGSKERGKKFKISILDHAHLFR